MSATKPVTSEEADAFMRNYLARPPDVTARLVFADWLEETCKPHNLAWAYYIRLKAEAERYASDGPERQELDRQANSYAPKIRANLTIPARLFVGYPKSLLQLLPASNITVRLANFDAPLRVIELMPESVARENLLFPLAVQGRVMLIAAADPRDGDTAQQLEFILNRDVILVGAAEDDIQGAIERHYGLTELEPIDSAPLVTAFATTQHYSLTSEATPVPEPGEPVVRLVNLILIEAITRRADAIRIAPDGDSVAIRFSVGGEWVEVADRPPLPFRVLVARLARMAWLQPEAILTHPPAVPRGAFHFYAHGVRLRADVIRMSGPEGPSIHVVLRPAPVPLADL